MPFLNDIVIRINSYLDLPKADLNGIAITLQTENKKFPALISQDGHWKELTIDDRVWIRIYHKAGNVQTTLNRSDGFGDSGGSIKNTFSMSMIVFVNRKLVNHYPDEVLFTIQSQVPDQIELLPFASVRPVFTGANMNDMQVLAQEYSGNDMRWNPENNLFQINYSVEAVFEKHCFKKCLD